MNILTICCALNNSYYGIEYDNKIITEIIKSDKKNYHSLYLIPKLKKTIKINNIDLKKLNAIAVNTGTGSFTGIRVAMSIAKVMSGELNLPLIPLNSAEILLTAFNADILITDARRDMYFYSTKEKTELIYKDKISDYPLNGKILTDKKCFEFFENSTCYEDIDKDLALTMIEIAKEKFNSQKDLNKFNPLAVEANYIQTPPVF